MEVRLGTWFGAGFGLWVRRFLCRPIFAGRFVWCRAILWRYFGGGRSSHAPTLTLEVEEHGAPVAVQSCVAIGAQQHQVVDVRRALLGCFPREVDDGPHISSGGRRIARSRRLD